MENNYINWEAQPIITSNNTLYIITMTTFIIISGGKFTRRNIILDELQQRNFETVPHY